MKQTENGDSIQKYSRRNERKFDKGLISFVLYPRLFEEKLNETLFFK